MLRDVAEVYRSSKAVHVDYKSEDKVKFDIVPMERPHMEKELEKNAIVRSLPGDAKTAIRIVKHVLDSTIGGAIGSYEVEAAITQGVNVNKHATVQSLVNHGIKYFTGRIKAAGWSVAELQARGLSFI